MIELPGGPVSAGRVILEDVTKVKNFSGVKRKYDFIWIHATIQ